MITSASCFAAFAATYTVSSKRCRSAIPHSGPSMRERPAARGARGEVDLQPVGVEAVRRRAAARPSSARNARASRGCSGRARPASPSGLRTQSSGGSALRVPRLPPEQHALARGMALGDPAGEVGPLRRVGLVRAVGRLPLVVERRPCPARSPRPRGARGRRRRTSASRSRRAGRAVRGGEVALRAPAAEDRLAPPAGRSRGAGGGAAPRSTSSSRCRRRAAYGSGDAGAHDERRRLELAVDAACGPRSRAGARSRRRRARRRAATKPSSSTGADERRSRASRASALRVSAR